MEVFPVLGSVERMSFQRDRYISKVTQYTARMIPRSTKRELVEVSLTMEIFYLGQFAFGVPRFHPFYAQ
jgi:intein-encoded DNA endonuclease-like protein